jgi:hypothetical protein
MYLHFLFELPGQYLLATSYLLPLIQILPPFPDQFRAGSRLHSLRPSSGYAGGIHPNVPQNGWKSQSASLVKHSWEDPSAFMR